MSILGVMIAPIRWSSRRSTFETIACSLWWKTPASAPCSISTLISSSVTGGSSVLRAPIRRSSRLLEADRPITSGRAKPENHTIGRATTEAMRSGASSASRLGTSSPITTDR